MTIEKTWEAVARCFLWHEQPTSDVQQQTRNEQAIVAAFALAVLEEASCDCDGSHESNCPWLEQVPRVRAVRARIAALGNEEA